MPRYFIEVAYKGTHYAGFQIQQNANSIQAEVEKAVKVFYKKDCKLTGSSRTDAGVHALQNFFHFDSDIEIADAAYQLNAILPNDIVIKKIFNVASGKHCRFDACNRQYSYYIYQQKNPFLQDKAYFFPYRLNISLMNIAAAEIIKHKDFAAFSKRNTQAKTTICNIIHSFWELQGETLVYNVSSNRFLRGMVRGLVGTMLQVGQNKISVEQFCNIIKSKDCTKANFAVPPQGLFLCKVEYESI